MANVIGALTEIFFIRNIRSNSITGDKVFISREKAVEEAYYCREDESSYEIDSVKLPFLGKYVSMVKTYLGFDYGMTSMFDVCLQSEFYPSVEKAKADKLWVKAEQELAGNPENFNQYESRICSKDIFGDDFFYGDVMEGNFSTEIFKYKVVR